MMVKECEGKKRRGYEPEAEGSEEAAAAITDIRAAKKENAMKR